MNIESQPKEAHVQSEREYVYNLDSAAVKDVRLSQEYPISVFYDLGIW